MNAILTRNVQIIGHVFNINVLILAKVKDLVAEVQHVRQSHIDQYASVL